MGGRGSSSGISDKGNKYGSQYETILEQGDIKFVRNNIKNYEPLMETMTSGRIYVQVGGDDLVRIVFMDRNNKRNKVIEYDKRHKEWHSHYGNIHKENSKTDHDPLSASDKEILVKARKIWHNHKG